MPFYFDAANKLCIVLYGLVYDVTDWTQSSVNLSQIIYDETLPRLIILWRKQYKILTSYAPTILE